MPFAMFFGLKESNFSFKIRYKRKMTLDQLSSNIKFQWCFLKKKALITDWKVKAINHVTTLSSWKYSQTWKHSLELYFQVLNSYKMSTSNSKHFSFFLIYICYHKNVFFSRLSCLKKKQNWKIQDEFLQNT